MQFIQKQNVHLYSYKKRKYYTQLFATEQKSTVQNKKLEKWNIHVKMKSSYEITTDGA